MKEKTLVWIIAMLLATFVAFFAGTATQWKARSSTVPDAPSTMQRPCGGYSDLQLTGMRI